MEEIFKRFPDMGKLIFKNLDNQSLAKSKEISQNFNEFIKHERFFWLRIIRNYTDNFEGHEESWIQVINKTPIQVIKQLIIEMEKCNKVNHSKWEPLNIAIEAVNFDLCKYILGKAIF